MARERMNDKPRLIDANELKKELDAWASPIRNRKFYVRDDAICVIDAAPTVDAVPVVRCRDCMNAEKRDYGDSHNIVWCNCHQGLRYKNQFCSESWTVKMDGKDGEK